jgi:CRP/FNR family transcriptional regulator
VTPDAIGQSARTAIQASLFNTLRADRLAWLFEDVLRLDIAAGSVVYREGESARLGLVVEGLVRVYLTSPDGRQITVRYARPGGVLGIATTVIGPVDVGVQVLTPTSLLVLNVDRVRRLGQSDAAFAWALADELGQRLTGVLAAFAGSAFGSVRQRIARHLLDLAAEQQLGPTLVARVTHQELADAVGTVREVVARTLRDLRDLGLIETRRDGIVVLDPAQLHDQLGLGRSDKSHF